MSQPQHRAAFIEGDLVWLRPVERSDYEEQLPSWATDREVTRYLVRGTFPTCREAFAAAYDDLVRSTTDIEFAVIRADDDSTVGISGLHSLQWVSRSAEFRVLIGDRSSWGRGLGSEVAQLVVAYGFEVLNLHRVWLGVNVENASALATYRQAGFVREGVLRDEVYRNGRYYDVERMSILRAEYDQAVTEWRSYERICRELRGSG